MSRLEAVCREQDAKWLHRLSLGIDDEEVCSTLLPAALLGPCPWRLSMWECDWLTSRAHSPKAHVHSMRSRLQAVNDLQTLLRCLLVSEAA